LLAIETATQKVLDARLQFPNSSLADLYDPLTMPPVLIKAHNELDKAVDLAYRPQPFTSEANRMVFLFELYEKYTADLFTKEKPKKFNHYKEDFLKQIQEYELFKRDLFANWQNPWSIFHSYFYRGTIRETVLNYLEQIAKDLLTKLELKDYIFHKVDFQGATNFGSDFCWIALYPITKESHKDSYQFFVRFDASPEAGQIAGWSVKEPKPNNLKPIATYDDAYNLLQKLKPEITKLNKESRNYFKFAPGSQASEWERFHNENIIAIDFNFDDLNKFESREEMNKEIGLKDDDKSNKTWNLWLFKTANIGDVVFATKGVNTCLGIGIIEGSYFFDGIWDNFNHRRKVKWITDKVYQYKSNTLKNYKNLFRPDTFSPTIVYEFILNEYVRLYPELASIFAENNLKFTAEKIGTTPIVSEPTSSK
jgi:5-methylcytosine-specific restriction protein B